MLCFSLFFFIIIHNFLFAQHSIKGENYYYKHQDQQLEFYLTNSPVSSPILSINTTSFLTIGHSEPKVKEVYGFFKFKEKCSKSCKKQTIDTTINQSKGILIKGFVNECVLSRGAISYN